MTSLLERLTFALLAVALCYLIALATLLLTSGRMVLGLSWLSTASLLVLFWLEYRHPLPALG